MTNNINKKQLNFVSFQLAGLFFKEKSMENKMQIVINFGFS